MLILAGTALSALVLTRPNYNLIIVAERRDSHVVFKAPI